MPKSKTKRQQVPVNTSPASTLPSELLCRIFHTIKSEGSASPYPALFEPAFAPELQWVSEITHVCHRWRAIALSDPTLWTDICVSASHRWAAEFLKRSKNLPGVRISSNLNVGAVMLGSHGLMKKENLAMCRKLYSQACHRVETLLFENAENFQIEGFFLDFLEGLANNPRSSSLKKIVILGHPDDRWEPFIFDNSDTYIFNPPDVEQLHLKYVRAAWNFLKEFQGLTHLHLEHRSNQMFDLDPTNLIEVLEVLPCLKNLVFRVKGSGHLQHSLEDEPSSTKQLILPHLHFVKVRHFSGIWMRHFLLNFSPLNHAPRMWDIGVLDDARWHKKVFTTALEHVPSHYLSSCELSMDPPRVHVRTYHARTPVLSFWPSHPRGDINRSTLPMLRYRAAHHVSSGAPPEEPTGIDIALNLLSQPRVYNFLDELDFSPSAYLVTPQLLAETIGRLPQLRIVNLHIEVASSIPFFSALTFGAGSNLNALPFKRLEEINVHTRISSDAEAEKEILRSMVERHRSGFPIRRLTLPLLHLAGYVRDVIALQKVVESITIKGTR
ncbi:hypothetical protein CPB83DRAFT_862741 [Crepidotus variabilis]|uniref:F-box domain-containing protein n=1 Tax=Crepidotus variabilis TaxID=179855 RepID=A0A9P6E6M1_9AGAR|nr:hypothetical protein CPB83DRAFT_862741 [Crepidotus variabilis]